MSGASNFIFSFLSCCAGTRPSKDQKGQVHDEDEEEKDDGNVHLRPLKKGYENNMYEEDWEMSSSNKPTPYKSQREIDDMMFFSRTSTFGAPAQLYKTDGTRFTRMKDDQLRSHGFRMDEGENQNYSKTMRTESNQQYLQKRESINKSENQKFIRASQNNLDFRYSSQRQTRGKQRKSKYLQDKGGQGYHHPSNYITPGGGDQSHYRESNRVLTQLKEDLQVLDHPFYEISIRVIDLLLIGKEELVQTQKLVRPIVLENCFYEEPLDTDEQALLLFQGTSSQFNHGGDYGRVSYAQKDNSAIKQMERRRYIEAKSLGNNTENLYLIDAQWIKRWVAYLNHPAAPFPGPIFNDSIYLNLESQKSLLLGEEILVISQSLWALFFGWYSGGPTLKWKIPYQEDLALLRAPLRDTQKQMIDDSPNLFEILDSSTMSQTMKIEQLRQSQMSQNFQSKEDKPLPSRGQKGVYDAFDLIKSNVQNNQLIHKPNQHNTTPSGPQQMKNNTNNQTARPSNLKQERISRLNQEQEEDVKPKLFGLENNQFFCYLNAVLQCILAVDEFTDYYEQGLFSEIQVRIPIQKGLGVSKAIGRLAEEIGNKQNQKLGSYHQNQIRVLRTSKLRQLIQSQFSPIMEHDSHEFLLYFFNILKDEVTEKGVKLQVNLMPGQGLRDLWSNFTKTFPSIIDRIFTTIEKTTVWCNTCQKEVTSLQYYLCFPIQVQGVKNLRQGLQIHSQMEKLQDYQCEYCKLRKPQNCVLTRKLLRLPNIFVFQLQRFTSYPKINKIRGLVAYEEYMDLASLVLDQQIDGQHNSPLNRKSAKLSYQVGGFLYELVSVAVHLGSIYGGHYVAYCKKEDGCWYRMDDERVGKVSVQEVLQQDAYLLFYRRVTDQ